MIEHVNPSHLVLRKPFIYTKPTGYKYALLDLKTIYAHTLKTVEYEPSFIFNEYCHTHRESLNSSNAFIGLWEGDAKLYMACAYVFETKPFFIGKESNIIELKIKPEKRYKVKEGIL